MAGHPLRPANDQSLGRPLPYQLANRARAPPSTPYGFESPNRSPRNVMRNSLRFPEDIPHRRADYPRVTHPCAVRQYCIATAPRTRLACVKHAASVRSEPGSNSRLKPVAWRKKYPGLHRDQPAKRIVEVARINSDHSCLESTNGFEQILAHRIGCQRASPPVQQKGTSTAQRVSQKVP